MEQLRDLEFLQQVFEARVSDKLQETGMRLFDLKTKKYELFDIWNHSQVNYGQTLAMYYGTSALTPQATSYTSSTQKKPSQPSAAPPTATSTATASSCGPYALSARTPTAPNRPRTSSAGLWSSTLRFWRRRLWPFWRCWRRRRGY